MARKTEDKEAKVDKPQIEAGVVLDGVKLVLSDILNIGSAPPAIEKAIREARMRTRAADNDILPGLAFLAHLLKLATDRDFGSEYHPQFVSAVATGEPMTGALLNAFLIGATGGKRTAAKKAAEVAAPANGGTDEGLPKVAPAIKVAMAHAALELAKIKEQVSRQDSSCAAPRGGFWLSSMRASTTMTCTRFWRLPC